MKSRLLCGLLSSLFCVCFTATIAIAQEKTADDSSRDSLVELELADGAFRMQAPESWNSIEPKSNMIEVEFKIPMADGDDAEKDGRLTIMAAGGGIDANISRWKGQFSQPDGSSIDDKTTVQEIEVSGMKTHMVDITGTFAERANMTAPPTMRDNYRMLAAIVETGKQQYFIKFYGGAATVEANKENFEEFIKSFEKVEK